ncbi:DNA-binding transcriptional regulator YbjK [Sphingomonas zeicaulis]|uniref:TetR/AcrR family transcriptional regulator n=1 Tax=Sphingomonas zeicaulis TaxID=1632740 RepID=UPI003D1C22B9
MPDTPLPPAVAAPTSPEKLVSAVFSVLEREGAAAISARPLAAAAGLPVSSIYYHFGDLEQLLESTQQAARHAATRWCEEQLSAIGTGAPSIGPVLAALADDWCEMQRPLAFARREAQLAALRDPRHIAGSAKWDALWQGFWDDLAARLGLADMANALAWLFDGVTGLHLLRWRRPVDRAALTELCQGWAGWLDGRIGSAAPWFERARAGAGELLPPPPPDDAVADAVAAAAARTIAARGVAGLTHRAVAAEAGVTLGVVSYKFRTSAELLQGAFEAIYRRMTQESGLDAPLPNRAEALAAMDGLLPERTHMLAAEELFMACARNPALQPFAARLRYLRGRTSGRMLQGMLGPDRPASVIDGAIISAFASGRNRACICSGRAPGPDSDYAPLLARLDRGAG